MNFTAKDVAALREKTGCGMMDCKKALTEAEGNMDKAIDLLREKGLAASVKKAGRIAAEGVAYAAVSDCGKVAVVVEVNAETDFVAKNAEFQAFVKFCADTIIHQNPADVEALLQCKAEGSELTVDALLKEKILTIGENIKVRRFDRFEGVVTSYVHAGGRIGVIVKFETSDEIAANDAFKTCAHNVAMQIAALNPEYLDEASVPAERVEKEKEILKQQLAEDEKNKNKPANVLENIVKGRIAKFFKEICLVDQAYVQDGSMSVKQYVDGVAKELGGEIKIAGFTRFEKGEGLEKREDNFAEEIASMVK
ncbi:elongation factor Ts [Neglecta sp. X4]|uniref:translation elongation factor Ts n=1 Tax=unclassified Neglectibacter TaxID=2632164 RepID=UPI001368E9AB|nr:MULTISPECIES: translation elongation factor Ts [unclassified Neglectibacter]NBI17173.1 elongation factor Ts [Neglectibacter sp. 59]NBJ72535.1 elongation factor Ts [Neglectibacter sp. X4]NCE80462.1 elongation factor Ts [Neglectibacter sp. X58]